MLKTRIHVDLRSAPSRSDGISVAGWLKSLFGRDVPIPDSGRETLSLSSYGLLRGIVQAFSQVNLTNAIAFFVDDEVIYLDEEAVPDDLSRIEQEVTRRRAFDRPRDSMHLVLHEEQDAHVALIDVEVSREVLLRQAEMRVDLVVRPTALVARKGESHEEYVRRVNALARDETITELLARTTRWAEPLVQVLDDTITGSSVLMEPARLELHRPDEESLRSIPALPFGDDVKAPSYEPKPRRQGFTTWGLPLYDRYYDDPYAALAEYVLIHALSQGKLQSSNIHVVDSEGATLLSGPDAIDYPFHAWPGWSAIRFDGGKVIATSSG